MRRVHVLNVSGPQNAVAFAAPLREHRALLREMGLDVRFHRRLTARTFECDVLFVGSMYYKQHWLERREEIFADLARCVAAGARPIWFDQSDSTFITQAAVLPHVESYCKNQLLVDRQGYLQQFYGGRIFTDAIHRRLGVTDEGLTHPGKSPDPRYLYRMRVGWNSALANYGPGRHSTLRRLLQRGFAQSGRACFVENDDRPLPISCRLGLGQGRATVVAHRREIIERLRLRGVQTGKLPPAAYFEELRRARISVSPFGLGEICWRDFETLLCGAVLFKPRMDHLETWPDLYQDGTTYVAHAWDLGDFDALLDSLLADHGRVEAIRLAGQERYRRCFSEAGASEFCQRVISLIEEAPAPGGAGSSPP